MSAYILSRALYGGSRQLAVPKTRLSRMQSRTQGSHRRSAKFSKQSYYHQFSRFDCESSGAHSTATTSHADVALGLPEASTAAGARGQLGHGNRQDDNHSQTGSERSDIVGSDIIFRAGAANDSVSSLRNATNRVASLQPLPTRHLPSLQRHSRRGRKRGHRSSGSSNS